MDQIRSLRNSSRDSSPRPVPIPCYHTLLVFSKVRFDPYDIIIRQTNPFEFDEAKRAKKPSLTLNLGTNGLTVTSEPPPMAGQAGPLARTGSLSGHLSKLRPRSTLLDLDILR
ncbi:hypothetical protein J6590_055034 [Homalodisca vitripennis]|nr:hypothetical protein J6590_055034 [Homalodisca vitripennis]